jgi:serine/threonine protein kinase
MKNNQIIDEHTYTTLGVKKLEPLHLRKQWLHDLAQAAAFLESFNLAHGDLQPNNILLHRDRVKLCDSDCTAKAGEAFEACIPPYARLLNAKESHLGKRGSAGRLGPRTELFALGSVYYFINYGFEVYGTSSLTKDPREHGRKVVDLLQQMEFPTLDSGEKVIDEIILKCWHNEYAKVADLAQHIREKLLVGDGKAIEAEEYDRESDRLLNQDEHLQDPGYLVDGGASKQPSDHDREPDYLSLDQNQDSFPYSMEKAYCEDLVSRGLVDKLSSKQPEELGFTMEWYRYSS